MRNVLFTMNNTLGYNNNNIFKTKKFVIRMQSCMKYLDEFLSLFRHCCKFAIDNAVCTQTLFALGKNYDVGYVAEI